MENPNLSLFRTMLLIFMLTPIRISNLISKFINLLVSLCATKTSITISKIALAPVFSNLNRINAFLHHLGLLIKSKLQESKELEVINLNRILKFKYRPHLNGLKTGSLCLNKLSLQISINKLFLKRR